MIDESHKLKKTKENRMINLKSLQLHRGREKGIHVHAKEKEERENVKAFIVFVFIFDCNFNRRGFYQYIKRVLKVPLYLKF